MNHEMMERRLTKRNKWSYTFGGLRDILYNLQSMFLLQYVQFTIGLSNAQFAAIGGIMVVCKVWDAINDPMMGTIIENSRLKLGKYRPWILIGAILNTVITISLFTIRPEGWAFVVFFGLAYLLWGMTFTINDVSFWSLLPNLSSDVAERNVMTTLVSVANSIGGFTVAAVLPMFLNKGNNISVFAYAGLVISLFYLITQVVTFLGVKEFPRPEKEMSEKVTLGRIISIIKNNDQLLWITVIMFFYYFGSGMLLVFGANFCNFEFGYIAGPGVYTLLSVSYAIGTFGSQAMYPFVVGKFGRQKTIAMGTLFVVIGYGILLLVGFVLPLYIALIVVAGIFAFFGQNFFYLTLIVEMTNTIEYNEYLTGSRNEAIVFSARSFLAKLTSALQQACLTAILVLSGINALSKEIGILEMDGASGKISADMVQSLANDITLSATMGMKMLLRVGIALIPILLMVISYYINKKKYNIDEEKYQEIVRELEKRKSGGSAE